MIVNRWSGDGTLGLVAGLAGEHDTPFFCIPVGTRNHFALDLGLNRDDPLSALDSIADGEELLIDYGTVGGRTFMNNVSIGIYAEAVHREEYRENKERTTTEVVGEMSKSTQPGVPLRFEGPAGERADHTALTIISTNPYVFSGPPDYGRRLRLDAGVLGDRIARDRGRRRHSRRCRR